MTQGTEWTEPGQGATTGDLRDALGDKYRYLKGQHHPAMLAVMNASWLSGERAYNWCRTTNLRLTGAPLTADDLKRIAECK